MGFKLLFFVWFVLLSVPLTMMMGGHQLALNPSRDAALSGLVKINDKAIWTVMHFVNPECSCSERVVESLKKRRAKTVAAREQVYVLGNNSAWVKDLQNAGYAVLTGTMDEYAEKYKINAVPQLVIMNSKHEIQYSGGYTSKRGPASVVEDQQILKEIVERQATAERPIFGCINGKANQKKIVFFGSKSKN